MPPNTTAPELRAAPAAEVDARASDDVAADPREVDAATWATRRRHGLDAAAQQQLQEWLRADARNGPALDAMAALLGELRQLPAADVAALRAQSVGQPARKRRTWHLLAWVPQAAVATLVVAVVGAGWFGWRQMPTFEHAYATARGQQVMATLPDDPADGSLLHLDTATRVEARLFRHRREVQLQDGQVMFTVHGDTARPFDVLAGKLRITVVGTRFSVRHTASGMDAGQTVVSVEEGRVRVALASPDGAQAESRTPPVELNAGQMLAGDASGRLGPVSKVSPTAIAPWRSGRISFDNTPLAQALAEFERYGPTGLTVLDPDVARLPVGGSYSLRQHQRFADALPQLLPVRLVQRGALTEIVSK